METKERAHVSSLTTLIICLVISSVIFSTFAKYGNSELMIFAELYAQIVSFTCGVSLAVHSSSVKDSLTVIIIGMVLSVLFLSISAIKISICVQDLIDGPVENRLQVVQTEASGTQLVVIDTEGEMFKLKAPPNNLSEGQDYWRTMAYYEGTKILVKP